MRLPVPSTPEERAVYQARLEQARNRYHKLVMGQVARVFLDQNGERVEYTAANAADLAAYIAALENALNPLLARARQPRPIGFTF